VKLRVVAYRPHPRCRQRTGGAHGEALPPRDSCHQYCLSIGARVGGHASYTESSALGLCRYMRHIPRNESVYDAEPEKCDAGCAITIAYGAHTVTFRSENPRTNPAWRRTNSANRRANPAGLRANPGFAKEPERTGWRRPYSRTFLDQWLGASSWRRYRELRATGFVARVAIAEGPRQQLDRDRSL